MTTPAHGLTAADDDRSKAAGGTGASGDIAAFQAKPGTPDGFVKGYFRRRESLEIEHQSNSQANDIENERPTVTADDTGPMLGGDWRHGIATGDAARAQAPLGLDEHGIEGRTLTVDRSKHRDLAFKLIEAVRSLVTQDETQSERTRTDYAVIARRFEKKLGRRFEQPGKGGCRALLDCYSKRSATFRLYKAALCWFLRQQLRQALAEHDRLQRAGDYGDAWLRHAIAAGQLGKEYLGIVEDPRSPPETTEGSPELKDESKRLDLQIIKKQYKDWDARMVDGGRTTRYLDVIRTMKLVGPRPEEFVQGVVVELKEGMASLTIQGAKSDEVRGQPWRNIWLPLADLPPEWQHRLQDSGRFIVQIESTDALRSALHRISGHCLPGVPFATGYVFRHAIATRLRRQGFTSEEIGAFLGHSAAETQATYGFKSFRTRGGKKLRETKSIRIETARAVRPLDRRGLTKILQSKALKQPKPRQR